MIIRLYQVASHLAQQVITSPWVALAAVTVLPLALGWPNVIYMEGIPTDFQPA